ncbi:MAG: hypothetical protein Ct9H300mP14_10830 [Gammaproteobacteria bacterium]|nr:MAG: hypothetical protein Ct9H300mP14_10830 [Gammaproteobacteria bacterium]
MRYGSVAEICHKSGLEYELEQIFYYAPIPFDKGCVSAVRAGADKMGYSAREIVTGLGMMPVLLPNRRQHR